MARLLHWWHLCSLDAPSVAGCWTLLFGRAFHLRHAGVPAVALLLAVWLLYVADRLLDAQAERRSGSRGSVLSRVYRARRRSVFAAALPAAAGLVLLLCGLPRVLVEAWLLLGVPMLGYGVAVHVLRMPAAWKPACVALFFAMAVTLPVAVQQGVGLPLLAGAVAFGAVCRVNCAVLVRHSRRRYLACAGTAALLAAGCAVAGQGEIALASGVALLLLCLLWRARGRMDALTYRALADLALVVPALVLLVR